MPRILPFANITPSRFQTWFGLLVIAFLVGSPALFPLARVQAQIPAGVDPNLVFYTHGDPSADEQYLLELINRARANPAAEGQMLAGISDPEILRYYSHYAVDTNKLRSDFAGYQAQPPLALNAKLMASSRGQSLDQAAHGFQGHDGSNGTHFDTRITDAGYEWSAIGENVYSYVETPFFGYVGMLTDWGVSSLDHRANILDTDAGHPVYKEIGISCVASGKPGVGPLVITQDFATPLAPESLLVGVAYNDTDGNGFYTPGEGRSGIVVTSPQSGFYTITGASGGYSLPLDQINGGSAVQIVFDDGKGGRVTRRIACGNNVADNLKVDWITGSDTPSPGTLNLLPVKNASRAALKAGKIRIVRDGTDLSQPLTVHYQASGSAVEGQDYTSMKGWAIIPAGSSSTMLKIHPLPGMNNGDAPDVPAMVTITLQGVDQDPLIVMQSAPLSLTID